MIDRNRIYWIDTIKAIGIFLVVFGHYVDTPVVKAYVYSFHMELFFFVAGLVYSGKDRFRVLLLKRTRTLILPYFIFSGMNYAFFLARRRYGQSPDMDIGTMQKLADVFTWNEYWFLGSLFVVAVSFYWCAKVIKTKTHFVVFAVICSILHYVLSRYLSDHIHENLLKCFTGIVFYGLGYFAKDWSADLRGVGIRGRQPYILIPVVVVNAAVFHLCYRQYGAISIGFYHNYFYFYALSLSGIFLTFILANVIDDNLYCNFVGAHTIVIYLMEGYPPALIKRFMSGVFGIDNFGSIDGGYACLYSVLTILILTPCIMVIDKYVPWAIGRRPRRLAPSMAS